MAKQSKRTGHETKQDEASRQTILGHAVIGGIIGGVVLALAAMIALVAAGLGPGAPWQFFASVLLGVAALQEVTLGVFLVGFVTHFVLSAVFGLAWGFVASGVPQGIRDNMGAHTAAAGVYGFVIYLLTFQIIARGFYPWFLEMNQVLWAVMHVLFFGIPLGLYLAARVGYVEATPRRREAPSQA